MTSTNTQTALGLIFIRDYISLEVMYYFSLVLLQLDIDS